MQLKTCKYTCKRYLKYVRVKKKSKCILFLISKYKIMIINPSLLMRSKIMLGLRGSTAKAPWKQCTDDVQVSNCVDLL